jgi:hypothetical protein
MRVDAEGISVSVPPGWDVRIARTPVAIPGAGSHMVMHAGTFALPGRRADFGGGAVESMPAGGAFVVLFEYGPESVGQALFAPRGLPSRLDPGQFTPNQLQRVIRGQTGLQVFFTEQNRAFCLYAVLGSHANRAPLAADVDLLLAGITVAPAKSGQVR